MNFPEHDKILYLTSRDEWRSWLQSNFDREKEIWLVFPKKASGKPRISYNDAVEEALCFGWIDSIIKVYDENHSMQRFTPRRPRSMFSQPNIERLRFLLSEKLVHPAVKDIAEKAVQQEFIFPDDIMAEMKQDATAWKNFARFSESYRRIRVAYVDTARERPEEFRKRLNNLINKSKQNKKIIGSGGIDQYY